MSRIWYCPNCGYEVTSRGRCHLCHEKLVASALPELRSDENEDEEVGYRLDGWSDSARGRLIESVNEMEILHRFEDDELVVLADDEARVDDLVATIAQSIDVADPDRRGEDEAYEDELEEAESAGELPFSGGPIGGPMEPALALLASAARRLREDPTDINADSDVAEASTAVFSVDDVPGADPDTWAAIGRVTRRLLAALSAEEALEDEIRTQSSILAQLLDPFLALTGSSSANGRGMEGTVYELPEWAPEQRAELSVLLADASIAFEWDGADLVVPSDKEAEVEALFGRVEGVTGEDEDDVEGEARYHALEELYAAAHRLAGNPDDLDRAAVAVECAEQLHGSPPVGFDEVQWFLVTTKAKALVDAIDAEQPFSVVAEEASALRDVLRQFV